MSFRLLPALFRAVFRLNIGGRLPPNPTLPAFFIIHQQGIFHH